MEAQGKPKEAERYESPECWRLTREQLLNGTVEDFARWRAEAATIEGRNAERLRMRSEAKQEIETLVARAWPRGSEAHKTMLRALKKATIERPLQFVAVLKDVERNAIRQREETTRKTTQDAESARMLLAAGAFLSARGKVVGVDYEVHEAIDVANEMACDEEIAALKQGGGFISFGGDDNCKNCRGWDMSSHRCDCGNRRVGWDHYGDFENMTVYAQAH